MVRNLTTMRPYSRMASCGVTFTVNTPGTASRISGPERGAPSSGAIRSCAFTSQTRTRFPARAATSASAAATVDFPTPPFPVTITSRRSRRGGAATRLDKLTGGGGQVHHALRRSPEEPALQEGARGGGGAVREGDRQGPRLGRPHRRVPVARRDGARGARDAGARDDAGAARREPALPR